MKKIYSKEIEFDRKLESAVKLMTDYVMATFGPYGKNVLINQNGHSYLTKDGVTVAKAISSNDATENAFLDIMKQAADKTVKDAGDGPQPLYSKVLTPNGFVEMGSLKIGDKICGTNNTIQEVIGIYPKGLKRIYKMNFSNNRTVECCLDHLWDVTTIQGKRKIFSVKELLESKIKTQNSDRSYSHKYYAPITSAEFYNKNIELDPFLVGLLIGDGSLGSNGSIELSLSLYQEYIFEKLILPSNIKYTYTKDLEKNYLRVKFSRKEKDGPTMHEYIEKIGLLDKKSKDKFIPKKYLYSSYENRIALLEGLMESDGYINSRGLIEYSTISSQLCNDFVELMRSLGRQVNVQFKTRKGDSYSNTPIYVISELKGYKYGIKLREIEETDQYTEMMCIRVSNTDNLYITDDYIVTHNTTTSILLISEFISALKATFKAFPKISSMEIKNTFESQIREVFKELEKMSCPIKDKKMLKDVAFMASNGDEQISNLIADLIDHVGNDGSISIKASKSPETYIQVVEGMRFNSNVASNSFLTDLQEKRILNDCVVIVSNSKIGYSDDIYPLIENIIVEKKSLLIVCPELDEKILLTLMVNVNRGVLNCCVVSPNALGNEKLDLFEDIGLICDVPVFPGGKLDRTDLNTWGYAKSVDISKNITTIIDGRAKPEIVDMSIVALRGKLRAEEDAALIRRLEARINRLTSMLGVVYVGGSTEAEIIEKKHRIEDALESCHSAIKKGIVPGAGSAFYCIGERFADSSTDTFLSLYIRERLVEIISSPYYTLYKDFPFQRFCESVDGQITLVKDLRTGKFVEPIENGIIESVWTLEAATMNAFSAAFVLTNTFGTIIGVENENGE